MPYPIDIEVVTEVPVLVGARVTAEGPRRSRLSTSVGLLPKPYVALVNATSTGFGWYDEMTADLIAASLESALVWRTHVGWRPWEPSGFFFGAGYGFAGAGGALTSDEVVSAAAGEATGVGGGAGFDASANLHMLDLSLGWEWIFREHLVLRAELGGAFTLGARARVSPAEEVGRAGIDAARYASAQVAARVLEEQLTTYVHTPTLGLGVGWRR